MDVSYRYMDVSQKDAEIYEDFVENQKHKTIANIIKVKNNTENKKERYRK